MSNETLKKRLASADIVLAPGVYDALSALVAEQAGFEALYLSGASIAYTRLGRSDIGLTTFSEVADTLARITERVSLPVIVDADTGFGNALNTQRTVRGFERAGAAMVQIEDQTFPKRCGHLDGKAVVPQREMVGKLKAALAARSDPALILAARTKSLAEEGLDAAVMRVKAYSATGVDAIWLVTVESLEQLRAIRAVTDLPFIIGTNHGALTRAELASVGARIMLQGHLPIAAAVKALTDLYARLAGGEEPDALKGTVASPGEMDRWLNARSYENWARDFM